MERIKATEPSVVAPIGTGGFEERAQASRKALEVRTDSDRCTQFAILGLWSPRSASGSVFTSEFSSMRKAAGVPRQDSTSAVKDRLEETVKGGKADAAEIARRGQGARVERTERELREAEEALASQELERWDEVFRSQSEQKDNSR